MADEQQEEPQEKKAWMVKFRVPPERLEIELNEMAADGYQAFRIEPIAEFATWTIIAFDPAQIAERQGRAMAETMAKLAGLPSMGPAPGPVR